MVTEANQPQPTWISVVRLLRWDKPAGRLILMIPALWAIVLATGGTPPLTLILVIVFGSLATSAAGCVVNDLWDRNIDPEVERTRNRPLASRALTIKTGVVVGLVAFACAFGLALYLNPLSFWLSVAAVPVIICYPLAKRVFPVPQLVLSIAWGFAVLISWSAANGSLEASTGLLWGATVLWTLGFDTVYAMSDREDDRRLGINSSALFFGDFAPNAVGLFFLGTAALMLGVDLQMHLHPVSWLALAIVVILWARQYWELRKPEISRETYGQMFRDNVIIGWILLAGMVGGTLMG